MKKFIIFIIKWTILLLYLILVLGFVKHKRMSVPVTKLNIEIAGNHRFVDTVDVNKMLTSNGVYIDSISLYSVNFDELEKLIEKNEAVEHAEVYADNYGVLNIIVNQRKPLIRVITVDYKGFYIDENGETMPLSDKYTAHVPVLNGYLTDEFIESLSNDTLTTLMRSQNYNYTLQDVYEMMQYIAKHELWSAQIQQVFINENKDLEIIPVVGNHVINLGSVSDYKTKLWKLEALYDEGIGKVDWNAYKTINLKYSNQIICSR
jgi:cell division protein FtsQ